MAKSAAQVLANYKQGMSGAGAKYTAGVQAVTDNPAAKAAAAVQSGYWAQRTAAAAPKLAARLGAVTLDQWKSAAASYGAAAYTGSVAKAGTNFGRVAQKVADAGAAGKQAAAGIPKSDAMGRIAANMAAIKAAWGQS